MPIPIQSVNSPFELSTDGVTWKVLICVASYNFDFTAGTSTTDTQCGRFIGLGFPGFTVTVQTVAEYDKTGTQVNQKDILAWLVAQTLLYFRIQSPANGGSYPLGNAYYMSGQAYITGTSLNNTTNDPVKFSITLTGQGNISLS